MWNAGGVRFVTSRILIVDMLNGLIPWKKLGGIVYYMNQGQMINENCTENFILRCYARQVHYANLAHEQATSLGTGDVGDSSTNTAAFDGYNDSSNSALSTNDNSRQLCIKAFTENPSVFAHGWNTLEKATRALKVGTKVFIWPRFRKAVNDCIKARQPESVQLHVDLAPIQRDIHQHLVTIFKLILEDLQRRCSGTQGPTMASTTASPQAPLREADISYDNALFSNFYSGIQAILEPLGSRVPHKIRSLLHDLNLLRDLLRTLIRCDAVTFYEKFHKMLPDQSAGDSNASLDWMQLHEADLVGSLSQERLWRTPKFRSPFSDARSSTSGQLTSVELSEPPPLTLEDNPKWRALLSAIREIEVENENPALGLGSQPILVLVRDEEARVSISEYLMLSNPSNYLLSKLKRHVLRKVESYNATKTSRTKTHPNFFADSRQRSRNPSATSASPSPTSSVTIDLDEDDTSGAHGSLKPSQHLYQALLAQVDADLTPQLAPVGQHVAAHDHNDFDKYFGLLKGSGRVSTRGNRKAPIVVQAWDTHFSSLPSFLEDLSPHFIILYDPDPSVVRQVECFKAGKPGWFVRLYVLIYANSLEHDKYLATLKQEQSVFTQLVAQKAKLAEEDAATLADLPSSELAPKSNPQSNRKGGNPQIALAGGILTTTLTDGSVPNLVQQEELVIVDTREFRSKLPGMLHQHGITIKPQTLVIADYILSPDIAVERKSIPDLRQSFRTGHLYNQIENLTRIYATPVLLVEFDSTEPFELTSRERLQPGQFSIHDLSSQLALLTKAFPNVRVCWSRSPAETAQLFLILKRGKPQPNAIHVSQRHVGLAPELSTHADEATLQEDPSEESTHGKSKARRPHNRRLLDQVTGSEESASATVSAPNLAPFHPMDVLKRLPGLSRESNWKHLLYPPTSASTTSSAKTGNSNPLAGNVGSSPSKLPDNPLDGSLFDLDDDEVALFSSTDPILANLDKKASSSHDAPTPSVSSTAPPTPPKKPIISLASLAALPKADLAHRLGSKNGTEIYNFLHRISDKSNYPQFGEGDAKSKTKSSRGSTAPPRGGRVGWRGRAFGK